MKLYSLEEAQAVPYEESFRESRLVRALLIVVHFYLAAFVASSLQKKGWLSGNVDIFLAGVGSLFLLIDFFRTFRASNWVVRDTPQGLLIKLGRFRDGSSASAEIGAVLVERREIASIRKTTLISKFLRVEDQRKVCLDVLLTSDGHRDLSAILAAKARSGHSFPVHLVGGGIVRIEWRGPSSHISPGIRKALRRLSEMAPWVEDKRELI